MTHATEREPDLSHGSDAYHADVALIAVENNPNATEDERQSAVDAYWDAVERQVQSEGDGFAPQGANR